MNDGLQWHDASGALADVPPRVRAWIRRDASMTQALRRQFSAGLRVRLLHEACGRLLPDERGALDTRSRCGYLREVALEGDGQVWLVARTVCGVGAQASRRIGALASLGERPLGELLFANGKPRWLMRQYASLDPVRHALLRGAADGCRKRCWARRTLFLFGRRRLLVTEVFMPSMFGIARRPGPRCGQDEA